VWADRIRYLREENIARITGNAVIIKGDLRIDADSVRATLDPGTNRFKKITATGNVRMNRVEPVVERPVKRPALKAAKDARSARCEIAVYDPTTGIVVLYGSPGKQPVVWVGKDEIRANVITYDRNKNLLTFEENVKISAIVPEKTETPGKGRPPTVPPTPVPK
jgi:lipopolysaccharide transport protein LptA